MAKTNKTQATASKEAKVTNPTKEVKLKNTIKLKKLKKEAKEEESPKALKRKKKELVKSVASKQKPALVEEVVSHREVKWKYPEDCTDTLSRKSWRQKRRAELRKLERTMLRIEDQTSKEFAKAKKAFEEKRHEYLKVKTAV